jgi:molybdenum cofactor cytidylyltransferase
MNKFGILVLAAGRSSRFGSDKLFATMPDGRPVIAHSLAPALEFSSQQKLPLSVVVRANNAELIDYLIQEKIDYVICPDAHLGMGNSIAHGIKSHQTWQGWMITLADMPNINIHLLNDLLNNIEQDTQSIVRPKLLTKDKSIPAHPVYFPQKYAFLLSKLTGDNGAKHIIQQLKWIDIVDSQILMDVDTPEVLQTLHKQKERLT